MKTILSKLILITMLVLLTSCSGNLNLDLPKPGGNQATKSQPSLNTYYRTMPAAEGSLWTDTGNMLFIDKKAKKVGDTIMVEIMENSTSSIGAGTNSNRASNSNAKTGALFGYMKKLKEKAPGIDPENLINQQYASDFAGKGSSNRSGSITASVAARIVSILPNGNIMIYGKRELKVNSETQIITISGIVRPSDIDSTNKVKSTYIADAKIEYSGFGTVGDNQKNGWFSRVISNVWPF
ncbi:MAG: flagellar basal body L-ring protein FlgH [Deltaproteobacteria bacterium]|nr:flagellar basal body L-ring protein FlgH [Deltaproteobacteria bacterium]